MEAMSDTYRYSPFDIAAYINYEDLKLSEVRKIEEEIWNKREIWIQQEWCGDKRRWERDIRRHLNLYDDKIKSETGSINKEIETMGSTFMLKEMNNEAGLIESFFKQIRLRLDYSGRSYVRCKFRVILKSLGYKRRNQELINWIHFSLERLEMTCFIKQDKCDFSKVDLDDMVTFRRNKQ
jgi:hypothetical protein